MWLPTYKNRPLISRVVWSFHHPKLVLHKFLLNFKWYQNKIARKIGEDLSMLKELNANTSTLSIDDIISASPSYISDRKENNE
jgi:hypothetical protein